MRRQQRSCLVAYLAAAAKVDTSSSNSCAATVLLSAVGATMHRHASHQKLLKCPMRHCTHNSIDIVPLAKTSSAVIKIQSKSC